MVDTSKKIGFLSRVQRAASLLIGGDPTVWMAPGDPINPIAPPQDVEGRQFDYSVGSNLMMAPKVEATAIREITMPQLRWLSESVEVLRMIIETRKDRICGMAWDFRVIGEKPEVSRKDPRVIWTKKFFQKPDGVNRFDSWLRIWQEDLITLDAPSIHIKRDSAGRILAFEAIDGATVKPLLNKLGRIPEAPDAAYMHVLKGFPAIYYSTDDLIYAPRNKRVFSSYGFGPVEQTMVYGNMAIRRQIQQLGYFTEGNMPEGIVPIQGTAEQVEMFQRIWDAGEIKGQKIGRVRFVPADNASKFIAFKEPVIADEFDELLTRRFCYVMGEDPTPFVKSVNRATAEQADKSSQSMGLNVQVRHVKAVLDCMIQDHLGFADLEAYVVPAKETDPTKVSERVVKLVAAGIMSKDEARAEEGLEGPAPEPEAPLAPEADPAKDEPVQRLSRADVEEIFDASASRLAAETHEAALVDAADGWLQRAAQIAVDAALEHMTAMTRAEGDWVEGVDFDDLAFAQAVTPSIASVWEMSASIALGSTGATVKAGFKAEAQAWAAKRAAWLVGKSVDPATGEVTAPKRKEYRISNECRDAIRKAVSAATAEAWTPEKITQTLMRDHAFSRARAASIGETEIVNADESGKATGWEKSGIDLEKRSLLAANENHGQADIDNAAQGWIPLKNAFQSGHMHPTYHVSCKCSTIARKRRAA